MLNKLSKQELQQIASVDIKFLSLLAKNLLSKKESVNEAGYTVKAKNPYQFLNGVVAVLGAYLRDEELGPKGKRELQDIIKSLDYMRKYFYFKMSESVNEADLNWNAVQNAIINFLKVNTKILDKKVQAKDTEGVKGGLKSIISGLTNAQRSLKLESAKKSTFIKVARISNNGKLDIY